MSLIFVSNLPKEDSIEFIQEFLEASFPSRTSIRILRSGQGHKGHAYVHFSDERAAQTAAEPYTVVHRSGTGKESVTPLIYKDGRTELRLRVCGDRGVLKNENVDEGTRPPVPFSTPNALIAAIEGMPLPPHCADIVTYKRCRYVLAPSSDKEESIVKEDNKNHLLMMHRITTVEEDLYPAKICVALVSDDEENKPEEGHFIDVSVSRCGPPSLKALIRPACGLREQIRFSEGWCVEKDQPRRPRHEVDAEEAESILDTSGGYFQGNEHAPQPKPELESEMKCMQGCSWLSPSETLDELRSFFDGEGRVAVKDRYGSVTVMNLPAYVASLE
ncbi:unnamed protein product [Phytomonas sp. Hart1]|nr:unnamed protein product [Phytomonas sp. Hart1]|eukprot:CCW66753.1 unnamed protein product [Phytomonas sp. isolate Hart1]